MRACKKSLWRQHTALEWGDGGMITFIALATAEVVQPPSVNDTSIVDVYKGTGQQKFLTQRSQCLCGQ